MYKLYSLPLSCGLRSEGIKIGGLWLRIFQDNVPSGNLRLIVTAWSIFYRLFQCQTPLNGNINILCIHSFTYPLNKYLLGCFYVPVLIEDGCQKHFIQGISLNTHRNVGFGAGWEMSGSANRGRAFALFAASHQGLQAPTLAPERAPARRVTWCGRGTRAARPKPS